MNKPIGAIDGDKFVGRMESIRDNARTIYARNAYNFVLDEVRSYILPSDQSEATRLREALGRIKGYATSSKSGNMEKDWAIELIIAACEDSEALTSSHREDRRTTDTPEQIAIRSYNDGFRDGKNLEDDYTGIQKVREEWEAQKAGGNMLVCAAIEGTAKALGYTIPGITEERADET